MPISLKLSAPPNPRVVVFVTNLESTTVNAIEQARFDPLYEQMLQALKLQGKRPKTIEAYSRAVRGVAGFYDRARPETTARSAQLTEVTRRHAATRLEALLRRFKLRWEDAT